MLFVKPIYEFKKEHKDN